MSLRMPVRSISIRRSSRASTVSRDIPILPRISPCCESTASARPPPWLISVPGPGGSLWPPRRSCAAWWPSMSRPRCWPCCASVSPRPGWANVECVQAGFLSYEHTGAPADAVYTRNALHQLPDFWKALALERIASMLRPGGVLRLRDLIFDFQPAEAGTVLDDWLDGAVAGSLPRLHARGLRRAPPHRVQHVPLAARADARRCRVHHRDGRLRRLDLRRLHLHQSLTACGPRAGTRKGPFPPGRALRIPALLRPLGLPRSAR